MTRIAACLMLAIALPLWAADEPADDFEDIEDVKTPLTLPELLPEGGIDAIDIDYWLLTKTQRNGTPWGSEQVSRHTIKPDGEHLVFQVDSRAFGTSNYRRVYTTAYTDQGELVSYRFVYYRGGKKSMEVTGKPGDKDIVLTTTRFDAQGDPVGVNRQKTLPLEPYETSLHSAWQPLVFAYHIRKGSLGYRFDRTDVSRSNTRDANVFEDVGTEQVEVAGVEHVAHLLIGKRTSERERRATEPGQLQLLVLTDGQTVSSRYSIGQYTYIAERITAEQAQEKAPLPDDGPEEPQEP